MSTTASELKTVAIFGVGGSCLAVLKNSLAAGHTVNVLARTPSKLASLSDENTNLHIVQGDIYNPPSVKETLVSNGRVVDVVVSGIGMAWSRSSKWNDKNICENGTKAILSALEDLEAAGSVEVPVGGPRVVVVSSTGISDKGRDIPVAMIPLYRGMLGVPHEDKKKMEEVIAKSERRWVAIRPAFLTDGKEKGIAKIRVGVETPGKNGTLEKAAVGYTISRADVGLWIFEELIKGDGGRWDGKMVTLTY